MITDGKQTNKLNTMNNEGLVVQMGSFNPLHRMHKRIADDAIARFPDYPHMFCMAKQTCDKGENSVDELNRRAEPIFDAGYMVSYVDSGLFIDVIKELRKDFPEDTIVFPVGEDTVYRFFRDWDKYYTENHKDWYLKRYIDYEEAFDNVEWYVSRRTCAEKEQYAPRFEEYIRHHGNVTWSDLDLDDISSSRIRGGHPNE